MVVREIIDALNPSQIDDQGPTVAIVQLSTRSHPRGLY